MHAQDLNDKLWDICEHRQGSSKDEQRRIAEEQWLEDHTGLISNHYISIMQVWAAYSLFVHAWKVALCFCRLS